jgi:hypothetical protein
MTIRLFGAVLYNDKASELIFSKGADFVGLDEDSQFVLYEHMRDFFQSVLDAGASVPTAEASTDLSTDTPALEVE